MLAGTFALAGWSATSHVQRRHAASRALERYARSRGLLFVPAPARPRGASPRVVSAEDEMRWEVDLFRLGGVVRTRVLAPARSGRSPTLSLLQRDAFEIPNAAPVALGNETFDRAYTVMNGAIEDFEALRDVMPTLLVLARRAEGIWLSSDGANVALSWRGAEGPPLVIDSARDVVVHLAGRHRAQSAYR